MSAETYRLIEGPSAKYLHFSWTSYLKFSRGSCKEICKRADCSVHDDLGGTHRCRLNILGADQLHVLGDLNYWQITIKMSYGIWTLADHISNILGDLNSCRSHFNFSLIGVIRGSMWEDTHVPRVWIDWKKCECLLHHHTGMQQTLKNLIVSLSCSHEVLSRSSAVYFLCVCVCVCFCVCMCLCLSLWMCVCVCACVGVWKVQHRFM